MAKRVVQECDLTKQEYDPAETVTLVIKRSGKKAGRTYELSAEAAAILEQQLVAGPELPNNWSFGGAVRPKARTVADLDTGPAEEAGPDDDGQFVASKKREMKAEGVDLDPREVEEGQATILPDIAPSGDCLHMNKGPVQTTLRDGERHFYRTCRECRGRIPEKQKMERESYLKAKAPADSRVDYKKD